MSASIALLLSGIAVPARAETSDAGTTDAQSTADPTPPLDQQEIVVTAPPLFRDVQPERSLDEETIESYGVSTIDELLGEVQAESGDDVEPPLLMVNGQRINDLSEIGALPVETLRNLQLLPRGTALKLGGTSNQRVINLSLRNKARSATVTAAHKIATDGNWNADRGEAIVTSIKGDTRANLAFRVRDESSLLESDRHIIQPEPRLPYALAGNIIGFPNTSGEVDPALSALAGEPVTVVPLPASVPTLAELAAVANSANTTDLGLFRTLRPETRNYDLNGTYATRLAPWLTTNATLHWGQVNSESLRGLPSSVFIVSPTNSFSPFATDVGIAAYGSSPLRSRSHHEGGDANLTFDATWGGWRANLNLHYGASKDRTFIDRQSTFGSIRLDGAINPFTADFSSLIAIGTDRIALRSNNALADVTVNGPVAKLPAGDLSAIAEAELSWNRLRSDSSFSTFNNGTFKRNEQRVRGAVDVPITSSDGFGAAAGDISASFEYAHGHFSDAPSVDHFTYGLTWEPRPILRLHGSIDTTSLPAAIQTIGGPLIVTQDVRTFDPLTGDTVDVTQITGGNPSLLPEKTTTRTVSALVRLVPKINLQLNAEYADLDLRNYVSALPEASAAVMLAFPDRFIRDPNGVLTTVDLRPVNFQSHREERLRWGFSMNLKLGGKVVTTAAANGRRPRSHIGRSTTIQVTANHTMVFHDEILIRPNLDPVDLLGGGAIGIGGGRVRHQFDATASLNNGGLGARVAILWRGPSELTTRVNGASDTLRFSSLLGVNLRVFADTRRFWPHSTWARGFRISLDAINVTNKRQSVRDSFGATPLQYQPAYRDRLGRSVELEIRKVF